MRVSAAFLLVHMALATFTGGGLAELCRLHTLPQHYAEHQAQEPELGVTAFLLMHYLDPAHDATDTRTHGKLPFRSVGKVLVTGGLPEATTSWPVPLLAEPDGPAAGKAGSCLDRPHCGVDHPPKG